ncbi:MFS general substrate transporter [Zopfia rhizophila CBS 207.26]|uniref:MFS general substrate transporter n=1 Tax=Zopfia rhizophila CBS 207.26 TaxID=1314779 RepID=A0A6A6D7M2_9PEZI|nr:MFS general substrate transporter [Zopfia rhizophila CBS 207.26]
MAQDIQPVATPEPKPEQETDTVTAEPPTAKTWRFWGVFVALCLLSFISALDVAIITTALPTITKEIGGETNGRSIQGVGAGGVYVLLDIVCCDLMPLRERGKYLGLMFSWAGLAAALGPVLGCALAEANWRWIFYLNIPICGVALGAILLFMRVKYKRSSSWKHALARVDYLGNLIFIPSIIAVLAGTLLSKFGAYRPIHAAAFALSAIGFGLFTLLDESTAKVAWVFFELIASGGSGMILSVLLPAIMAALPESDVASASAAYSFIRTFGYIWGVTIPSIFSAQFNKYLYKISSVAVRNLLADGAAYAFASNHLVNKLEAVVRTEARDVYARSLNTVWCWVWR